MKSKVLMSLVLSALFAIDCAALPFKEIIVAIDNYNPQLQIARTKMMSNRETMRVERNLDDPKAEFEMELPKDAPNAIEMKITQDFSFPTKYVRMKRSEELAAKKDSIEYQLTRKEIICNAYDICAEIIYLNQILELDSINCEFTRNNYDMVSRGLQEGLYNILEVNESKIEMIKSYVYLKDTKQRLAEEIAKFDRLFNQSNIISQERFRYFPDGLVLKEVTESPYKDLISITEQLNALQLKVVKAEHHPVLTAGYKMTKADDVAHGFIVGSSIPVFSARGKTKLVELGGEAEAEDLRLKESELMTMLKMEYENAVNLEEIVNLYDAEVLKQIPIFLKKLLDNGRISQIEYKVQLSAWYESKKTYLEQKKEYYKALLKLSIYNN